MQAAGRSTAPRPTAALPVAMLASVAALAALSFLLRIPCIAVAEPSGLALAVPGCRGDLEVMWFHRGLASGQFPYLEPFLDPETGRLVTVEYPVLTGVLMWLLALPGSFVVFVALSTLVSAIAAAGIALLLHRWCGARAWLWAAAPALAHYLAYNYDALPALTVVAALVLVLGRDPLTIGPGRYLGAAALLGIGGGLKLYPLLFVLPLALWLLFGRPGAGQAPPRTRLARAAAAGGVAAAVIAAVNLPFLLANPQGWWLPFSFQATRPIDASTFSVWYLAAGFLPGVPAGQWMGVSAVATAVGIALAALAGWLVGRRSGRFPLLGTAITVLVAYLLLNKVHSPQYVLWLLPLLVLAGVRVREVVTYLVIDVGMFWSLGFVLYTREAGLDGATFVLVGVLLALIVVRVGILAWLAVRAATASDPDPARLSPAVPSAGSPGPSAASG